MRVRAYEDFLDEINEAIIEGTICGSDIIKVIRVTASPVPNYLPISEYYFEDDECDDNHEEILVRDLLIEIKSHMSISSR